jgi:pyridine nucleotide-disulfide oxidoreductase family protein
LKDLVLLGGGHSHVAVLRGFGRDPLPGARVTLISRGVETPYSGMLPGLIAGHYSHDEAHIDLQRLARFARARPIFDEAVGLDLANRRVLFDTHPPISYDVLSIDIGSTPHLDVAGAAAHAVPVKPISRFLDRWSLLSERLRRAREGDRRRVAVVGGGAGGVELLLAVQFRMRTLLEGDGKGDAMLEYHLFTKSDRVLPTHNTSVRRRFERVLAERGVVVHTGSAVVEVDDSRLRTADGRSHDVDEVLWTTEAAAAPWLAQSGLAVDEAGFVRVRGTLQSISHPEVFASGDIAAMVDHPRPKSGVFAVRQGPPLARNLRDTLLGRPLETYRPQRRFLSLITTGDRYAVASRGMWAFEGAWVWRWKDRIDRRFMRLYRDLPDMKAPAAREPASASALLGLVHWLVAKPWLYNVAQNLAGAETVRRHLRPRLQETGGKLVLDVGAGTGLYLSCFPPSARYIWLDPDPQKLDGFRAAPDGARRALLGDATCLGLRRDAVDFAVCTNVTHHLDEKQLAQCVDELARVVRGKLILHDAVKTARPVSRLLWRLDRGSHPRTRETLLAAIERRFAIEQVERYSTWHEYLLLVAVPRAHEATSQNSS